MPSLIAAQSPAVEKTANAVLVVNEQQIIQHVIFCSNEYPTCSANPLVGQHLHDLISPTKGESFYRALQQAIKTGQPWYGTLRYQCRNEENSQTRHIRIIPVGHPPHDYIIAEYALRPQHTDSDPFNLYLEMSKTLGVAKDVHTLSTLFLDKTQELTGIYALAIGMLTNFTPSGDYTYHVTHTTQTWNALAGQHLVCSHFLKDSLKEQRVIHLPNAQQTLLSQYPGACNVQVRDLLILPLFAEGNNFGVLLAGNLEPFTEHQKNEMKALASMFSHALHRQSLYENLNAQLELTKKAQRELIQTEKLASLGRLLAGVAHELNTPLTSIILYAQMAIENLQQHPARKDVEQVLLLARRAAQVLRGMLEFSAKKATPLAPVHLEDALQEVRSLIDHEIRAHHIHFRTHISPNLPPLLASNVQIQQVFINLITNAIHAITEYRRADAPPREGQIKIQMVPEGKRFIHLTVKDNGIGMSKEVLSRIFDPFFTTRETGRGTGLGLSICHGIVTRYGGKIWAESIPEQGSTFHVVLPAATHEEVQQFLSQQARPLPLPNRSSAKSVSRRLLVVDDEESIRKIFVRILKRAGYQVDTANDGLTALDMLMRQDYDLVICDINIPGLSGDQLYRTLAEKKPAMQPKILFITGDTHNERIQTFLNTTNNFVLTKPFDLKDFLQAVEDALSALG